MQWMCEKCGENADSDLTPLPSGWQFMAPEGCPWCGGCIEKARAVHREVQEKQVAQNLTAVEGMLERVFDRLLVGLRTQSRLASTWRWKRPNHPQPPQPEPALRSEIAWRW